MSDLALPQTRMGGSDTFKRGSLKKRLDSQTFATLAGSAVLAAGPATETQRFKLTGLSGVLNVQIAAGFVAVDGNLSSSGDLITPSQIPAGGATIQVTPLTNFGDKGRMMLRPVFQDPTLSVNNNNPLPMDLPLGWEFATETDEAWIDIVVTRDWTLLGINNPNLVGLGVLQVTIEYNGQWWDTEAIKWSISQVQLTPGPTTPTVIATALT